MPRHSPGQRRYESQRRARQAAATKTAILARRVSSFIARVRRDRVADIAAAAHVNIDTVYAAVGRSPS